MLLSVLSRKLHAVDEQMIKDDNTGVISPDNYN